MRFKNANNCLNTNIYSYLETLGGQSSNIYLNVVNFFNTSGLYYKTITIVIDAPSVVKSDAPNCSVTYWRP